MRACYNCLSTRHRSRDCPSHGRCRECNGQHHSLLHIATHTRDSSAVTNTSALTMNVAAADLPSRPCKSILRTAVALVDSGSGCRTATLMFDEGAEVSLITSSLARAINACFKPCSLQIDGVGPSVVTCRHTVDIYLHPIHREQQSSSLPSSTHPLSVSVHCYVVKQPFHVNTGLDSSTIRQLVVDRAFRPLADPALDHPAKVELLLCGGDSHRCYPGPEFYSTDRSLRFVRTLFGWTLGGAVPSQVSQAIVSRASQPSTLKHDPEDLFHLLWTQDQIPGESTQMSEDDHLAIDHFSNTHPFHREHSLSHCLGGCPLLYRVSPGRLQPSVSNRTSAHCDGETNGKPLRTSFMNTAPWNMRNWSHQRT